VYILYVVLFLAGLIAVSDWRGDARADADAARAAAVATQMASYHQQVLAFCQANACASGPILPGLALPPHMRDVEIYGRTILSVFDGSELFVTYYRGIGTPIEKGRIAEALATRLHGAANAGRYNLPLGQVLSVFRDDQLGALRQMNLTVPQVVGGQAMEDGDPMVATRMSGFNQAMLP
jgi:hypothetical protein